MRNHSITHFFSRPLVLGHSQNISNTISWMFHLQMWRLLHDLLILLYYLLQLGMLLHYSLVLKSNSVMGMLLPLSCCCLQLLQSQIFLRVIRRINVKLEKQANTINKGRLFLSEEEKHLFATQFTRILLAFIILSLCIPVFRFLSPLFLCSLI